MGNRWGRRQRLAAWAVVALSTAMLAACSHSIEDPAAASIAPPPLRTLTALSVARATDRSRIVDRQGREIILRGANLNALGDYDQADPKLVPTKRPTAADWDAMAAHGFSVVRLIVSWSRFEPERGAFDERYLAQVRSAVNSAQRRGMYTVIDFHQDAWGKFIASPKGVSCAKGLVPAIGWDGAPQWATVTDGASTCRPEGYREGAAAVTTAFTNFYRNRDGIRDAYVATVAKVAAAFATDPAVAGYDLMNEPNKVLPDDESTQRYTELTVDLTRAIRRAEAHERGGFHHLLFLEPIVLYPLGGTMPVMGKPDDPNIVFAPHNYGEVITKILTTEATFGVSASTAAERGWPLWIGEYGVFGKDAESLDVLTRFAKAEDEHLAGSAEWQWRQRCGDPHTVGSPGGRFTGKQYHLTVTTCPADTSTPNEAFLRVVGRAYARSAPGQLTKVASDPATGALSLAGRATAVRRGSDLVVWVPGRTRPAPHLTGLAKPTFTKVDGGWYLVARPTATRYSLTLAPR
ncbi:MAG: hypothetical protein JWM89_3303 [Acidimicrobiales bacterium]|nr:hypothetical protein [Acidimicrobiales bacterium]